VDFGRRFEPIALSLYGDIATINSRIRLKTITTFRGQQNYTLPNLSQYTKLMIIQAAYFSTSGIVETTSYVYPISLLTDTLVYQISGGFRNSSHLYTSVGLSKTTICNNEFCINETEYISETDCYIYVE
jgi:hypothetical protein